MAYPNPINNNFTLPYDFSVADTGKDVRGIRSAEMMETLYKIINRVVIYETPPIIANRHIGQIWVDTSAARTGTWQCDANLNFTIQIG